MPLIDMPLRDLERYQGINPRPADFDAYWARGLAEMEALGTDAELSPAPFQAPGIRCEEMYFTGVGGARVFAKLLRPEGRTGCPAVLQFHGYRGDSGDWSEKLAYAAQGFVVAALDCRGQGGRSEDVGGVFGNTNHGSIIRGLDDPDPDKLLMRQTFLDTAQLARIVMALPEVDASRVGAMGGSQGGGLTLACAALTPDLKQACARYPFLCDYQRVWEMDLSVSAYAELREYFRHFDPQHHREQEVFTKLGYIDVQHLAPRIQANVLMYTGLMDQVCPPSTQFAAYNKIAGPKQIEIFPDFAHETLPGSSDMTMLRMLAM
ncbi:acetylxylan esterase [Eubacteriales bacterium OttesenSCG-928-A19]|nr:acetylxylan esterase [Eubacteriales bacterium OttesenSCG-928-A19]